MTIVLDGSSGITAPGGTVAAPSITTTGDTNTGIFFPAADTIAFSEGGTESLRIDSGGNLGLGVTPSAWDTTIFRTLQVGSGVGSASLSGRTDGSQNTLLGSNLYYGSAAFKYVGTGSATYYNQQNGVHSWYYAASGTAGNTITFTQAMTLDASGNLVVGGTSATSLGANIGSISVNATAANSTGAVVFQNSGSQTARIAVLSGFMTLQDLGSASGISIDEQSALPITFKTNATERARISSDGTLQVGRTSGSAPDGKLQTVATGTGAGAANTKLGFALIEDDSGNGAGLWLGAMTNQNTGVIGSRTASGNIAFQTYDGGWAERMRLTYQGAFLVGTTSAFSGSGISPKVTISNTAGLGLIAIGSADAGLVTQPAGNTNYYAGFFLNSSSTGIGNISCTSSATAYNTSSDYRLKNTVAPMTGALAKVALLKPVTYKWNADGSDGQGFIAHELAEVVPDCVTGEKDAVDVEGNPRYQGVDTSFLVATLTAAIQELTARVAALEGNN